MLSTKIRSDIFQNQLRKLWAFAAQHAGEVHINNVLGLPPCKYELGQRILARVPKPESKLAPRLRAAVFLGYAPNVTNGFFVIRSFGVTELISKITEDTIFDETKPVLEDHQEVRQAGPEPKPPKERLLRKIF